MASHRTGGEYTDVNGLSLYFETHGEGLPLVLLHGGFGTIEMFDAIVPMLARSRKVIAPDLQGHGRTADVDRPLDRLRCATEWNRSPGSAGSPSSTS